MQTNMTSQQLYTLMAGLSNSKRRLLKLLLVLMAFKRDAQYYCVTVPLATVRYFWRLCHPGQVDSSQDC